MLKLAPGIIPDSTKASFGNGGFLLLCGRTGPSRRNTMTDHNTPLQFVAPLLRRSYTYIILNDVANDRRQRPVLVGLVLVGLVLVGLVLVGLGFVGLVLVGLVLVGLGFVGLVLFGLGFVAPGPVPERYLVCFDIDSGAGAGAEPAFDFAGHLCPAPEQTLYRGVNRLKLPPNRGPVGVCTSCSF